MPQARSIRAETARPAQAGRDVVRILLLEDRDADAELVERALRKAGFAYKFERARGEADFLAKLEPAPHIIVSDYYVPGCDALHALRLVRGRGLDVPFILVSGVIGETRALEALRLGATDFLLKDRLGRLGAAIKTALEVAALRRKADTVAPAARLRPERGEHEFREAFANAAIGMALTTLDGRWLQVNRAFSDLTGYPVEELRERDCHAIAHPDDVAADVELLQQLVAGTTTVSQAEKRYVHKQGHAVWVQVTASLVRDRDGEPLHRILQVIDITERKQTEARLARADRARRVMAGCSYALVHAVDERQFLEEMCRVVVDAGRYVQAYVGLAENDEQKSVRPVASAGFEDGYLDQGQRSWSSAGKRQSVMGGVIAGGMRFISRNVSADAKLGRWAERARSRGYQSLICLPLRIEERSIGGISIYAREPDSFDYEEIELLELLARDISYGVASLRARAELRASEEHFRATFEQAAVGVAHTTRDGRFLRANRRLCEILGYTTAELLQRTNRDLIHPDDRDQQQGLRRELLEGRRASYTAERRYLRKDGATVWISRTVTLARPVAGEPYLIQVVQDVSERKRTEARLERVMRARRVMAECNHALIHAADETEMLGKMCRILVESGGYKMAWVGLATGDRDKPIAPAAHAGFGQDAPMTGPQAWSRDGQYLGFMAEVIATGEPHVARNIMHDRRHERRRPRAVQHGFQSSIGLPLLHGPAMIGAIGIYALEADAFDDDEIALLTELTGDIAYGIDTLRTRIAREQAERNARENGRRFEQLFEQAAVGMGQVGLDGRFILVNQTFADLLGYAREELIGKTPEEVTHPEDRREATDIRQHLAQGTAQSISSEKRYLRKDGSVIWVNRTASLVRNEAGDPLYFTGIVEDITERKEIERRFELTFAHAAAGMLLTSVDGRYVQVNQRFADMLGYTPEEMKGIPIEAAMHPEDRPAIEAQRRKLKDGEVLSGERRFLRKDGRVIWARRTVSPARDASGNTLYYVSVVEDITETKQREEHYRAMFHNAAVGITRVDLGGRLVDVNQKFCDMLGYTREELAGKEIRDITHPEDFGQGSRFRAQLAHGETRSASGEKRFVRKDGAVIWARRTMSTVCDEAGNPQYVISVVEDITERKELERRFELTFNHAAVGMTLTGLDGRLMQVNQKYAEMLGYTRDELRGMTSETLTHAGDLAETVQTREQLIDGRIDSATGEKRLNRKDRRVIWVRRSVSVARDAGGEPLYFIAVVDDITDRKEAAERYRATFEHAPVGIMHTSIQDDHILHANAKLCEMLGYTYEEIAGLTTDALIHPTHVGADQPRYREKMLNGEMDTFSSERLYRRKDGSDLWVDRTVSLARDVAGTPLYFIRIIEDIHERKQAQEAVTSERALLRTIIDTVPDYIYVKDAEGRFQLANKAWLRERGYEGKEIAGKTVFEVFSPPELAQRMAQQDAAIVQGGEPMLDREQLVSTRNPGGRPLRAQWTAITKVPMRDAAGNIVGTVGISRDITEQKLTARRREMEHAVTRVLSESESLDQGMTRILQTICEGLEWASGAYWQWDEDAELLRCVENWHIPAEGLEEFAAASRDGINEAPAWRDGVPPGGTSGGLVRTIWQSGAPVWFPDIGQRADFRRGTAAARANLHCAFGFPILSGGLPLGIMEFYGRDIQEPDEALLQIVRAIGSQIGQFIQRKGAEQALRLSEERHRDQFEASPLPMWVWDDQTLEYLAVNQAAVDHYGYSREEFLRMSVRDIWVSDEGTRYDAQIRDRAQEQLLNLKRRHRTKDGRIIDVEATARRFVREGRTVWLTLVNDVSVRLRAEQALQESEEQFRQLANNIPQVFWITDVRQKETLYLSPAAETLLGWPLQQIRDNPRVLIKTLHHEDRSRVYAARKTATAGGYDETYRIVRPDGSIRWVHDRAFPVHDPSGAVYRIAGIAEDITERKLAEERLLHLAHYDVLTSLPNRVLFYDRLRQALAQAKRNEWVVGVMLIDVDRFKNVNDTLGHAVGDQLLQQVSERLTKSVRSGDTVGRLGGDEFAVVLSNLASAQDASLVAQKIMASFKEPFRLGVGGDIYVTASIGITLYPDDSAEQDALIKNADAAMYRAKESGRNSYRFYTPEMNARAQEQLSMENSMRRALAREEFLLHYQPKVSVVTGGIVGLEALLRWRHPERGLVSPGEFMPVLEDTGLIVPVGEWVIRAVCEQIALWQRLGIEVKPVAVNLSARQFSDKDLATTIKRIIDENGIDAQLIDFEITESSVMTNTEESTRVLEFLGQLGVGLSIDDFGTGYSSLGYLKRFPLDALKIDRSFVRDIITSTDDATITRAVISMAHSLGLKVIAEGVETEEQLNFLAEHGCDEFQGYLFSRPLPADDCAVLLREKRALPPAAQAAGSTAPIVLLVDDDSAALTLLKRSLAKDSYRILTAGNAHEGLELLGKYSVDLVISDQNMPGIPGVEFLRRVGALFPNTTRMMTSAVSPASVTAGVPGVEDAFRFLPKDMSEEELRAGVREALARKVRPTGPVLRVLRPDS